MEVLMLRVPHLPEQILQKLDDESLSKSREVARPWQNLIDGRYYTWLRIVEIPTILQDGNTYLHLAAETGQIEEFKIAFNEEEDKNVKNDNGETPFHLACAYGCSEIVQYILKTPFSRACNEGHTNVVKILAKNARTFRINCIDYLEYFHEACESGFTDLVKVFMESAPTYGIDLNTTKKIPRKGDTGLTAFQNACIKGDSDLVQTFIQNADEFNFDLNVKDNKGWTAFHYACVWGHSDLVKIFLENAATVSIDINKKSNEGMTPFHIACLNGYSDVAKIFMENRGNLNKNITNDHGETPLHLACKEGQCEIVQLLLENTHLEIMDVNAKTIFGETAFELACRKAIQPLNWNVGKQHCRKGRLNVIKILMENAANLEIDIIGTDASGRTAFIRNCILGHSKLVKMFIENSGINLNTNDDNGRTGFHWACNQGHSGIVKIFMENTATYGIDLNMEDNNGMTAFHIACHNGHSDVVEMFLENASDLNIDLTIRTQISNCHEGHSDVVKIFLDNALDLTIDLTIKTQISNCQYITKVLLKINFITKLLLDNAAHVVVESELDPKTFKTVAILQPLPSSSTGLVVPERPKNAMLDLLTSAWLKYKKSSK